MGLGAELKYRDVNMFVKEILIFVSNANLYYLIPERKRKPEQKFITNSIFQI